MTTTAIQTNENRALIRALFSYIRPYRGTFILGTIIRFLGEAIFAISPYIFSQLILSLANHAPNQRILLFFILMIAGFLTRSGAQRIGRYFSNQATERAALDAEEQGVDELVQWSLVDHEAENTGNKLKRIQKGAEGVNRILRLWQDNWIAAICRFSIMLSIIFIFSWKVGMGMILFIISYLILSRPLLRKASTRARVVSAKEEEVGGFIFEITNNIRTVKVMNLYPWLRSRLRHMTTELFDRIRTRIQAYQSMGTIMEYFSTVIRAVLTGYIVWGVTQNMVGLDFLLLFNMNFTTLRDTSEQLNETMEQFTVAKYGILRMEEIKMKAAKNNQPGNKKFPSNWKTITLKNVSFSYGDNQVLNNLSFTIKRGEKIGIVGLSGAGKSTLFKLLLKEHDTFAGTILIDDIDLRDISPGSFAEHAAVVLQDTEVFNLSLKDNITLSRQADDTDPDRLAKALTVAHVNDFLVKLPHGIDTEIGEKGVRLSGGQRQRVGIARAVFKEPDLLFLDEATSHLDLESEEKIQDSLHQFFREVTAIVIAHRLTTIKEMDRILVIDGGKIIEEGNFETLHTNHGKFFDLWEKQKL